MRWRFWMLLPLALGGCKCAEKTDEERLRERLDTTKVHLYLATKIAILKADQSDEARAARDALLDALSALQGQPRANAAPGEPTREFTARDAVVLATSLYHLKREGEELLESGDEKGMKPILPSLFDADEQLVAVLDLNLEHALLLTGMFVAKFHPRSPTPLPPELLLYEAWMTKSESVLPGLRGLVRAEKAVVFGTNELCDLATQEARGVDAEVLVLEQLVEVMQVAGATTDLDARRIDATFSAIRALAHGVAAACHQRRGDGEEAVRELDLVLVALQDSGVPAGQLALLRAYVANRRGEHESARRHLEEARDWEGTTPETKRDIETLLAHLETDPNLFEKKLGDTWFTYTLTKIVLRRLDEIGAFDELKETALVKTVAAYASALSRMTAEAQREVSGAGVLDRVRRLLSE